MAYVIKNGKTNLQQEAHIHQPTQAHSHFTRAVAAMDSCIALIEAHQRDKTVGSMDGGNPCLKDPLAAEASEKHSLKRQLHAQAVDWCMCAPCFN